jgi:electron transport complex protein RnfD
VILGLSLPCTLAPGKPHVCIIAGVAAIGLGKACFGGLGQNIFNPAMAGRSFVMLAFPAALGAGAYVLAEAEPIITMATPLSGGGGAASLLHLAVGKHNGSLGETSGLACVVGGLYLCVRGAAAWEIPASMLITASACAALAHLAGWSDLNAARQLLSGALLFGAFFIATDPVTSPLTFAGKVVFGAAIGLLVMLIRVFGGYPEGVMFAVLVLNAATPLINRLMIPKPVGAQPKPKPAA